jgi:hypothetical protein
VEESAAADSSKRALAEVLGVERRDRILAALYLSRQDTVGAVRQASVHIWKALVSNTPRTGESHVVIDYILPDRKNLVREILAELIGQIILLLAGSEDEQLEVCYNPAFVINGLTSIQTASRTMGELCRKSGEKVLTEIVGILRSKSTSQDSRTREGAVLAVSELVYVNFSFYITIDPHSVTRENTTDTQREDHEDEIIAMVRTALVDDESNVRAAAAKAFDTLQEYLGPKAIDQTIPTLLDALRQPGASSGTALQALKEVMSVCYANILNACLRSETVYRFAPQPYSLC